MAMEIELKFLLPEYPEQLIEGGELKVITRHSIDQTYLAIEDGQELRVRKITDLDSGEVAFTHTFKDGKGISRKEIEYDISEGLYNQMIDAVKAIPLVKTRTTAVWNGITVEIDVYTQLQLTVIEVEFDSLEEAESFNAPEWFGEDVSTETKYSNKTVWKELQKR
ncbi:MULTISPECIES: CYTH domain-containing protein [unclassified Paenibacillus]|uniref:CYTH domain-containing protein n=1 Tax=unclassified Paenibacillus TaxID=185978 RepID=UPI00240708D5|nr:MULTISPECIES: CYTH domain-containing protein [unclassified Paenibacillus]MDF9844518.1 adenylate cyclase [Paenibacillus sp. PastF-2]MDF9851122.1 adenylate cyclase [Paenibacillus sp. PastM-2]MDF9857694.1 adenylate cyclase [Paenibacillus sp. PastF-1]MDH6482960.1 adenylate cyclase [Paenibacillus sp. PastH-2]MDH6510385.1 adenylate cyclase [Paenibacillus sp. PastM-3]